MGGIEFISTAHRSQDDLYRDAVDKYGSSLGRLASTYEADPAKRRDLSQDIHFQLWRTFQLYDARCFLRTWTYRVARQSRRFLCHACERRIFATLVSLEELEMLTDAAEGQVAANQRINLITLFGEKRFFDYAGSNALEFL